MDCIFCKIIKGEIPCTKIFEDENTLAFLDINPVSNGHTLVVSKMHAEKIHDLSIEEMNNLMKSVRKVSIGIEKALNCDFNILNNNGKEAEQVVPHVHFHVIPRGIGEKFNLKWPPEKYKENEEKEVAKKITDALS